MLLGSFQYINELDDLIGERNIDIVNWYVPSWVQLKRVLVAVVVVEDYLPMMNQHHSSFVCFLDLEIVVDVRMRARRRMTTTTTTTPPPTRTLDGTYPTTGVRRTTLEEDVEFY